MLTSNIPKVERCATTDGRHPAVVFNNCLLHSQQRNERSPFRTCGIFEHIIYLIFKKKKEIFFVFLFLILLILAHAPL